MCRPGLFYSFSFAPNPSWTSFFPNGKEILGYLHKVCNDYQIVDKIQLNTDVSEIRWLEDEKEWEITLTHLLAGTGDLSNKDRQQRVAEKGRETVYTTQEIIRAKVVVSAAGGLVEPNGWPESIPGLESFEGEVFHSARWRYDVDLTGKDVIVIGTGMLSGTFTDSVPF